MTTFLARSGAIAEAGAIPGSVDVARDTRNLDTLRVEAASTLVVLQPAYLPWLGFFDQLRRCDVFVYYDDVQFDKHGWRNRNRIKALTARGG